MAIPKIQINEQCYLMLFVDSFKYFKYKIEDDCIKQFFT